MSSQYRPHGSWQAPHSTSSGNWHYGDGQRADVPEFLPGLDLYFPPRQMSRMHTAYRRARKRTPLAYPTFQHFVIVRVSLGLAQLCVSFMPGVHAVGIDASPEMLVGQLQRAAQQLGVGSRTLVYRLVVPAVARREQFWQALRGWGAHMLAAHWGRRGCTTSLAGLVALAIVVCGLLAFAEATATLLLHHLH